MRGPSPWQYSEEVALKLGVRNKVGENFTVAFVIVGPSGQRLTAVKAGGEGFTEVAFPADFQGWDGKTGSYSWRAIVASESVAGGSFVYEYDPSPTIRIVRSK